MPTHDSFQEFHLLRIEDESGISGTGVVARGQVFPSGKVIMEWCSFHTSITTFSNLQDVEAIHGHQGKTKVVMGPPPELSIKKRRKRKKELK